MKTKTNVKAGYVQQFDKILETFHQDQVM